MKVVKCINGDFFDLDTYEVCPKCGAKPAAPGTAAPVQHTSQAVEKPKKKGLFGGWKKNHTQSPAANQFSQNNGAAQSYSNPPQTASGAAGSDWPQQPVNPAKVPCVKEQNDNTKCEKQEQQVRCDPCVHDEP